MDEIENMSLENVMLNLWEALYCIRRESKEQQEDDDYSNSEFYDDVDSRMHVVIEESERAFSLLQRLGDLIEPDGIFKNKI